MFCRGKRGSNGCGYCKACCYQLPPFHLPAKCPTLSRQALCGKAHNTAGRHTVIGVYSHHCEHLAIRDGNDFVVGEDSAIASDQGSLKAPHDSRGAAKTLGFSAATEDHLSYLGAGSWSCQRNFQTISPLNGKHG